MHYMKKVLRRGPQEATLLNFFSLGGKQPLPLQKKPKKPAKPKPPQKTRVSQFGRRPLQQQSQSKKEKVAKLHQQVKRKYPAGSLTKLPQKHKEMSGSVSKK